MHDDFSLCAVLCSQFNSDHSNGDSSTRKGIYLQKILKKTHIQAHNTRHRKRRTSLQRKTKVQRMYVNVWGKHYMRTINTYLLDEADADTTIHKTLKNTLNGRCVEVLRLFTRIHAHRHHPACYVPTIDLLERRTLKTHTQTYVYQRTISDKRDRIDAVEFELKRRSHKSHYRLFHSVEFLTHLRSGVQ